MKAGSFLISFHDTSRAQLRLYTSCCQQSLETTASRGGKKSYYNFSSTGSAVGAGPRPTPALHSSFHTHPAPFPTATRIQSYQGWKVVGSNRKGLKKRSCFILNYFAHLN